MKPKIKKHIIPQPSTPTLFKMKKIPPPKPLNLPKQQLNITPSQKSCTSDDSFVTIDLND